MKEASARARAVYALCLTALVVAALASVWPENPARWSKPLAFDAVHHTPAVGVLFASVGALLLTRPRRWQVLATLALVGTALAYFAAIYVVLPLLLVLYIARSRLVPATELSAYTVLVALLALGLALPMVRASGKADEPPATVETLARAAFAEGNRQRALLFARQWAAEEGEPPGHAVILLARVASSLGDDDVARLFLARVANEGRSDEVKAAARALLESPR